MRRIEIEFTGKLIYKSNEDLPKEELEHLAMQSLVQAEIDANKKGNPRLHIHSK